jgi:hypothetical protein
LLGGAGGRRGCELGRVGHKGRVGQIKLGRRGWGRKEKGPATDLGREGFQTKMGEKRNWVVQTEWVGALWWAAGGGQRKTWAV